MRDKKKKESSGPNQSYLISFGDTMTALLAFFIVLNSLASDQTGANLHSGTGSFIQATDSLGVPGIFPHGQSLHAVQLKTSSPLYRVEDDSDGSKRGSGPDEEDENLFIRDRELDNFERMLNELERLNSREDQNEITGEVTFDRHQKLPTDGPILDRSLKKLFAELRPLLSRNGSEAEIIIWTPTPSPKIWARSARTAAKIQQEASKYLQLTSEQTTQLSATSRQWSSATLKRPVLSVVIRRLQ